MLKYDFKQLDKPVIIDEPAILDIYITDNNKSVSITVTTASGIDHTKLDLQEGQDGKFTVQIGNIDSIKFGGTDNWGYYKLILEMENNAGAVDYDSILVNNITVDPVAGDNGWCKCEKVSINGTQMLKYTAISANTSDEPRYALFKHKTTDKIITGGANAGRAAAPEWWVTVMLKGGGTTPPPGPEPPEPEIINVTDVTINESPFELISGRTLQLSATVSPEDATDKSVTWSSDNPSAATISSTGLVTAKTVIENTNVTITVTTTDGNITATVTGVIKPDQSGPVRPVLRNLDDILTEFDSIVRIRLNETPKTYQYLEEMYNAAQDEYLNNTHGFFDEDMYPELPEVKTLSSYRGNNEPFVMVGTKVHLLDIRLIMTSWLMAMCMSEIAPTCSEGTYHGKDDSNQTKFFKAAYEMSGGRDCPLYAGYSLHSDPTILRLAAAAVYALVRGTKTNSYINELRKEINQVRSTNYQAITGASEWSNLKYIGEKGSLPTQLGYVVNADHIIPSAPGPYVKNNEDTTQNGVSRDLPYEQGQPETLFYKRSDSVSGKKDWWNDNYKVDVAIDNIVCENYIMSVKYDGSNYNDMKTLWIDNPKRDIDKKNILLSAVMVPSANMKCWFCTRDVYLKEISKGSWNGKNYLDYYTFKFELGSNGKSDYVVSGPFSDLQDIVYEDSYKYSDLTTTHLKQPIYDYFKTLLDIGDNSRYPSYLVEYNRRVRPLGNINNYESKDPEPNWRVIGQEKSSNSWSGYGDPRNGIVNESLTRLFADEKGSKGVAKYEGLHDNAGDQARSYPSGHASQTMTVALILSQAFSNANKAEKIKHYISEAYKIGVCRTVTRHHWQSDTMYGRLFATMIIPIINAMTGLESSYNILVNSIKGDSTGSGVTVTLHNNTDKSIEIRPNIRFIVRDGNTSYATRSLSTRSESTITIGANATETIIQNKILDTDSASLVNKTFASENQLTGVRRIENPSGDTRTYSSNIIAYSTSGEEFKLANVKNDSGSEGKFIDDAKYAIEYGSTTTPQGEVSTGPIRVKFYNDYNELIIIAPKIGFRFSWTLASGRTQMGPVLNIPNQGNITLPAHGTDGETYTIPLEQPASPSGSSWLDSYYGINFATTEELNAYKAKYNITEPDRLTTNLYVYCRVPGSNQGSSEYYIVNSISPTEKFRGDALYEIHIGGSNPSTIYGGSTGEGQTVTTESSVKVTKNTTPTPIRDMNFKLTINNTLSEEAAFNGEVLFYMNTIEDGKLVYDNTGKNPYAGDGIILPGGINKQTNSIKIPANSSKTFDITIPAATINRLSNVLSPKSVSGREFNFIPYTYTLQHSTGNKIHTRLFVCGFVDNDQNGVTLVNGSTHFVDIKSRESGHTIL